MSTLYVIFYIYVIVASIERNEFMKNGIKKWYYKKY